MLLTQISNLQSNSVATPTQQISSDTIPFTFKATAIVDADPIGTFNTYTYAANGNAATISASAPTQTVASMNADGFRVFARAFNATSTAASPARVDIKIGKGLKAKQVDAYGALAKGTSIYTDKYTLGSVTDFGTSIIYNEVTGVLTLECAVNTGGGIGNKFIGSDAVGNGFTSGYFVFNASTSPSITALPILQPRIAYLSDVKASGTAGGSCTTGYQTRTLNTIVDNTGIVTSLVSNQFILPAGTFEITASAPARQSDTHRIRLRILQMVVQLF